MILSNEIIKELLYAAVIGLAGFLIKKIIAIFTKPHSKAQIATYFATQICFCASCIFIVGCYACDFDGIPAIFVNIFFGTSVFVAAICFFIICNDFEKLHNKITNDKTKCNSQSPNQK